MTRVITGLPAGYQCAAGGHDVAREGFLRHLKTLKPGVRKNIAGSYPQASNLDLRIRTARARQEIVDRDLRASTSCGSAWRRQMRREKNQRDRTRRYFANEKLKSANLDLKIRRAHARQKLVDIDLRCDGRLGAGG